MNEDLYKVKDLYLAAFLHAQGKELLITERDNNICWFTFADKTSCEALARLYWSDKATSKTKSLVDSIRTLKDLIFSQTK